MNRCTHPAFCGVLFVWVFFSPEQLGQDVLHSRPDLDTDNAHNSVQLSPEETPVEIMLGKVINILRYREDFHHSQPTPNKLLWLWWEMLKYVIYFKPTGLHCITVNS